MLLTSCFNPRARKLQQNKETLVTHQRRAFPPEEVHFRTEGSTVVHSYESSSRYRPQSNLYKASSTLGIPSHVQNSSHVDLRGRTSPIRTTSYTAVNYVNRETNYITNRETHHAINSDKIEHPVIRNVVTNSCTENKEIQTIKNEVHLLRKELMKYRDVIGKMQEREKILKDRLSEQAQRQLSRGSKFEDLSLGDNRPTQLIRRYGNLYSQTRLDAYDALDDLPEMSEFDDLKGKLLFSVVVLAFRSVQQMYKHIKSKLRGMMGLQASSYSDLDSLAEEVEATMMAYLRKTVDKYDLTTNVQEVSNQVYATLYDYPSLKTCQPLKTYIEECVRLAWSLTVQNPPLVIDFDRRFFKPDCHSRFHTSDPDSTQIKDILWPALLEGDNGPCVHKGVVVT